MIRHVLAITALALMAACAGSYDYIDEAPQAAAPAPPPPAIAPPYTPPPPVQSAPLAAPAPAPTPRPAPAPSVAPIQTAPPPAASGASIAAPNVVAPPAPRPAPPRGDVVVPGTVERQVLPPTGDPRSATERARDIRAWDDCVMRAQNLGEANPTRPALDQPEDLCRQQLGMASRNAVPDNRRP